MGGKKFLSGEQPDCFARNGAPRRGRACGPRPARDHGGTKNSRALEKRRPTARRGQCQSVFGKADSLYATTGFINGGLVDRGKHRRSSSTFARGTGTADSLSCAGASTRSGGD